MDLSKYNLKRDFNSTTEPKGEIKKSKNEPIFVVQKHAASHLHYDFRLEMDGLLKSWAIPKGPSMNPKERRLAIMVEDHPYTYKDFEGNIPKGNYGAGTVIVWDTGTYTLVNLENEEKIEEKFKDDIQKGHLSFILNGKKLKGEFALVRLKVLKKNAWLLIKKEDQYARKSDVLKMEKSVISNLTLKEIEK
jgi:bifunctional non-homologous end joining protein LigD